MTSLYKNGVNVDENPSSLEKSLIKSITLPKLHEVLGDLGEIGLDSVMEDGLAKDIPFIGSVIRLHATFVGIKERLFLKKVVHFLYELSEIPAHERQEWSEKLETNPDEQRKVGEAIILLLDRLDSIEKAAIIGKIFRAHIEGEIDHQTCTLISSMVDRAYTTDLEEFAKSEGYPSELVGANLANVGLMSVSGIKNQPGPGEVRRMGIDIHDRDFSERLDQAIASTLSKFTNKHSTNKYGYLLLKIAFSTDE